MKRTIAAILLTFAAASAALAQTAPNPATWRDPAKSPDQRARDLLPLLTLEEKIALLHADGTFTSAGVPRLGIGKLWMSDGPNGVREEIQPSGWNPANRNDDFATAMPASVGLAASFDPELAKAYGNVIGEEAKIRGKNIMLGPGLNIMRTPLNGRNSEYFGEDPFLASRMAVGFITGMQQNGVAACAKHYALNNQETNRNSVNVKVDERTMREIYLPAFKAAVTEAHVWSVMSAYNRVNGQYCSENDFLLNQVLKKDWNFQGLVMTDWGGCHSTVAAARNGLDLEMGSNVSGNHNNDFFAAKLQQAIGDGPEQVPMSRIDDMALRNLRVMAATGLLDVGVDRDQKTVPLMAPAHLKTARDISAASTVLLKNSNNVLPIDAAKVKSIAVIGDIANAHFAHDGMSAAIKTRDEVAGLDGIRTRAGNALNITFAQGYTQPAGGRGGRGGRGPAATGAGGDLIAQAVTAAKAADVAIVFAGLYRAQDQEAADRPSFELPAGQSELIQAVTKANPKTIVILTGGSPSNVSPWINDAAAFLMYWYGGVEGGNALASLLFGDVNPSGHLPCTWPKQIVDSPAHNPNDPNVYPGPGGRGGRGGFGGPAAPATAGAPADGETYAEGIFVGYRWFDAKKIEPQFPFGFGLSYTTFGFDRLGLSVNQTTRPAPEHIAQFDTLVASFTVKNNGPRAGAAAAQLYIQPEKPSVDRPVRELKAISKVMLNPGESREVSLTLAPRDFAYYSPEKHAWIAEPGDYTILVGDSSRSLPLKTTYHISETTVIKEGP